jgi:phage/plasmid-like protein (TIGR03299 family)
MAHMIDMSNGKANMAFVGQTPWHGLGFPISEDDRYNVDVFEKQAGLNFHVNVEAIYRPNGQVNPFARSFVRSDTNAILGVVGPNTQPLQNKEAFQWFQPFLESKLAELHTAGSLDEGRKVWVLAKISGNQLEIVKGDAVDKFVLLSNSHDGTTAIRVGFTPIRVVCMNTLRAAHGDKASKLIRIRHTKDMRKNMDAVREVMSLVNAEFEATAEQFKILANKAISRADLLKYVTLVIGKEKKEFKDESTRMQNIINEIIGIADSGRGTDIVGVQGTLWGAYNAVTEFLQWEQGRTSDTRLNNMWFGTSVKTNEEALKLALDMAA